MPEILQLLASFILEFGDLIFDIYLASRKGRG
jgi:hypothetical protein